MQKDIQFLHGEPIKQKNSRQIQGTLLRFLIIALVGVAGIVFSLIWRDATHMNNPNEANSQIITIAITLVVGSVIIFLWGMKLSPRLAYRKYLRESHRGLSRHVEGVVVNLAEDLTFREGLYFYAMIVNVGDIGVPEDDRLLYYDAQLGRPPFSAMESVRILAHGNDIIGFDKAG